MSFKRSSLRGIDRAKEIINKYMYDRPILIYGDPDCDGLFSLLFIKQLLDMLNVKYSYYINSKRVHGFTLKPSTMSGYLIIAVDFEIDRRTMQSLIDNDICIVSMDHHDTKDDFIDIVGDTAEGVVLNNQYFFEEDEGRYNSGAGVVYECCCDMYPQFKSDEREALVGVTLLSDARPLENTRAEYYLRKAYTADSQSGYIGYLVTSVVGGTDFGFGVPKLDRNFIDYKFSPRINSLFRFGMESDALNFILGKGLVTEDTQARQNDLLSVMKLRVYRLQLSHLTVLAIDTKDFLDFKNTDMTCFIGLLCSSIKGTGVSTLGVVVQNGTVIRASFRGRYADVNYLAGFQGLGIDAQGHPPAFGIKSFTPEVNTWNDINELIMQIEELHSTTIHIVDSSNLSFTMLQHGMEYATHNCYVRDNYRTYIRYTGSNIAIQKKSYKMEEFTPEEYTSTLEPDSYAGKKKYKYIRDENNNPIVKYIGYLVDGKLVKSFGVPIETGIILPILEKGHIQLYVREMIE